MLVTRFATPEVRRKPQWCKQEGGLMFRSKLLRAAPSTIMPIQSYASNAGTFDAFDATHAGGSVQRAGERDRIVALLVARMANKDEVALGQLYDMTVNRLHTFALGIVCDPGLAKKVTEDALFQAWREAHRFDVNRDKVISWLLTICRSRALDALRRLDAAENVLKTRTPFVRMRRAEREAGAVDSSI